MSRPQPIAPVAQGGLESALRLCRVALASLAGLKRDEHSQALSARLAWRHDACLYWEVTLPTAKAGGFSA